MNIKWNANKYTEDFSFVHQYGNIKNLYKTEKNLRSDSVPTLGFFCCYKAALFFVCI